MASTIPLSFGRQDLARLDAAAQREWLVTDGLGGFAMGSMPGLATRRYHGLLVVSRRPPGGNRMMSLVALDPTLVLGERRTQLAVHEWASGAIDPCGHVHLESFRLKDGVPTWRWSLGDVQLERQVAMLHGRPAVAVLHRLLRAPLPVRLELSTLCTWRDAHEERQAGAEPAVDLIADGFIFEGADPVAGSGFVAGGGWYVGSRWRVEAARGLSDHEDLWHAGTSLRSSRLAALMKWSPGRMTSSIGPHQEPKWWHRQRSAIRWWCRAPCPQTTWTAIWLTRQTS